MQLHFFNTNMSADPQNEGMRGELSRTSKTTPNLHPKWLIFDVILLIPWGHIYTNLAIARLVAAIEPVKRTSNVEELKEEPDFEWILKALNEDESGCQERLDFGQWANEGLH